MKISIRIWCLILIILITLALLIWFLISSSSKQKNVKKFYLTNNLYDDKVQFDFAYTKKPPVSDIINFSNAFKTVPAIFGNVINQTNGSSNYINSILSFTNVTQNNFIPQIYQTWPVMGINWVACEKYIGKNLEINFIENPEDLVSPYPSSNFIKFSSTFDDIPIVILSEMNNVKYSTKREFGVYNITTSGFQVTWYDSFDWADEWPTTLCFMAIHQSQTTGSSFIMESGSSEFGKIPTDGYGWDGYVKLQNSYQYKPIILTTLCYDDQYNHDYRKNNHMNTTIDSISRQSFHVAINEGVWPSNARINWISIVKDSPRTSDRYPINMISDYIVYEPSKSTDEKYYVIEFNSAHRPGLDDSCIIANGIDTVHMKSENETIDPDFPMINIINLNNDKMKCQINERNIWPKGGMKYIRFSRDPESKIDQSDQRYIIDFGIVDKDMFSNNDTIYRIPFNIEFPSPPKILTCYNGFIDFRTNSAIGITAVFPTHFEFTSFYQPYNSSTKLLIPKFDVHWVAIYENPKWTINSFPYQIQINQFSSLKEIINTLPHQQPDNFSPLNNIFGLIPFSKPYRIQPPISLGCGFLGIDSIHNSFLHVNTCLPVDFLQVLFSKMKTPITWLIFIDTTVKASMPFSNCDIVQYIDPQCPTLTTNATLCDVIDVSAYLPLIQYEYLEKVTEISTIEQSGYLEDKETNYLPIELDNIVICNIHLSYATRTAWSQYGEVCSNAVNHLKNDDGNDRYFTQWNVNTDYGYFSSCKSFGSILIRINSSFPSDKILKFHFYGTGASPNNKYYVQWGTGYDMIQGPFDSKVSHGELVELEFGHAGCGPSNVYCKIKKALKGICKDIVKPFLQTPQNWVQGQACSTALYPFVTGTCIAMFGGPEDVFADAACPSFIGYPAQSACTAYVRDAEMATDADRLLDYDRFASAICDKL